MDRSGNQETHRRLQGRRLDVLFHLGVRGCREGGHDHIRHQYRRLGKDRQGYCGRILERERRTRALLRQDGVAMHAVHVDF